MSIVAAEIELQAHVGAVNQALDGLSGALERALVARAAIAHERLADYLLGLAIKLRQQANSRTRPGPSSTTERRLGERL